MRIAERTALIVNDNPGLRAMLKALLEAEGCAVECASNGREGIGIERRFRARLVITDLFMPELQGLELIDALKKEFAETKIVVMSGNPKSIGGSYFKTAEMMGADAIMMKPFAASELLEMLGAVGYQPDGSKVNDAKGAQ